MSEHVDNIKENKAQSQETAGLDMEMVGGSSLSFQDNRPEAMQRKSQQAAANEDPQVKQLQAAEAAANESPEVKQLKATAAAANASPQVKQLQATEESLNKSPRAQGKMPLFAEETPAVQRKGMAEAQPKRENKTGMPDDLKAGLESLSGMAMDDVKVHYNSDKPAQLQAHAYAQGTDIHIAPGQEQHLPHEAWHVVQQKQGRVQATTQMKGGEKVNDDAGLETEADVMGGKAVQMKASPTAQLQKRSAPQSGPVQRVLEKKDVKTKGKKKASTQFINANHTDHLNDFQLLAIIERSAREFYKLLDDEKVQALKEKLIETKDKKFEVKGKLDLLSIGMAHFKIGNGNPGKDNCRNEVNIADKNFKVPNLTTLKYGTDIVPIHHKTGHNAFAIGPGNYDVELDKQDMKLDVPLFSSETARGPITNAEALMHLKRKREKYIGNNEDGTNLKKRKFLKNEHPYAGKGGQKIAMHLDPTMQEERKKKKITPAGLDQRRDLLDRDRREWEVEKKYKDRQFPNALRESSTSPYVGKDEKEVEKKWKKMSKKEKEKWKSIDIRRDMYQDVGKTFIGECPPSPRCYDEMEDDQMDFLEINKERFEQFNDYEKGSAFFVGCKQVKEKSIEYLESQKEENTVIDVKENEFAHFLKALRESEKDFTKYENLKLQLENKDIFHIYRNSQSNDRFTCFNRNFGLYRTAMSHMPTKTEDGREKISNALTNPIRGGDKDSIPKMSQLSATMHFAEGMRNSHMAIMNPLIFGSYLNNKEGDRLRQGLDEELKQKDMENFYKQFFLEMNPMAPKGSQGAGWGMEAAIEDMEDHELEDGFEKFWEQHSGVWDNVQKDDEGKVDISTKKKKKKDDEDSDLDNEEEEDDVKLSTKERESFSRLELMIREVILLRGWLEQQIPKNFKIGHQVTQEEVMKMLLSKAIGYWKTDDEALGQLAGNQGLKLVEIPMNGDCLFNSVLHQLGLVGINGLSVQDLRARIVTLISNNEDYFQEFFAGISIEKVADQILTLGSWNNQGGDLAAIVLPTILRCPIIVIRPGGNEQRDPNNDLKMDGIDDIGLTGPITIAYNGRDHYWSTEDE